MNFNAAAQATTVDLTNMSHPIQRCTKGDEALDYLYRRRRYAAARDQPLPALILLDLNLPGADGRYVLSTIKGDPQLACIPVIIVTSSANPKDINACYQNGANSYLVKSVNFLKFRQQIGVLTDYRLNVAQLPGNQTESTNQQINKSMMQLRSLYANNSRPKSFVTTAR